MPRKIERHEPLDRFGFLSAMHGIDGNNEVRPFRLIILG